MSIANHDVEAIYTNPTLETDAGIEQITDAIIVYDSVHGGLRLSKSIFDKFSEYVSQLRRAWDLAGKNACVSDRVGMDLEKWSARLQSTQTANEENGGRVARIVVPPMKAPFIGQIGSVSP